MPYYRFILWSPHDPQAVARILSEQTQNNDAALRGWLLGPFLRHDHHLIWYGEITTSAFVLTRLTSYPYRTPSLSRIHGTIHPVPSGSRVTVQILFNPIITTLVVVAIWNMVAAVINGYQLSLDPVVGGVILGIIVFIMYFFREAQITRVELEMLLSAEKSTA